MFKHMKLKKLIPLLVVVGLASLIAGTDVLSAAVQNQFINLLKDYVKGLVPYTANIFVGLIAICLANLFYDPLLAGMHEAFDRAKTEERHRVLIERGVRLGYWVLVTIVGVTFIAPDLLAKLVVGVGLFGAAIALALQGLANDVIAGLLLNFRPKFCVGDEIELVGVAVKGKVKDISYLLTIIETNEGIFTVPNREVWAKPVKVSKPGAGSTSTEGGGINCPAPADSTTTPAK